MLIDDEMIERKFFTKELEEIEEIESNIAQAEGELNEILEEVEDWDEEEQGQKTAGKVKEFLKQTINDLLSSKQEAAIKEAQKWQDLNGRIDEKDKELKKLNKELKQKQQTLEESVKQKRETLTQEEAKVLLLEKFKETIKQGLEKYINAEKKELIKVFEKLWDKYKISLKELLNERDQEVKKLNEFLKQLGYANE
jgi:type I restriction enzyme M protein